MVKKENILEWLTEVKDPEIPVLSLVDLGVIKGIEISPAKTIVTITPTFVGCPALDVMKSEIVQVLQKHDVPHPQVIVSFEQRWSSDDITENGKVALRKFGLAPPRVSPLIEDIQLLEYAECPNCGSQDTELRNPFGPTLCRSIHYCRNCREAFEQFKPL